MSSKGGSVKSGRKKKGEGVTYINQSTHQPSDFGFIEYRALCNEIGIDYSPIIHCVAFYTMFPTVLHQDLYRLIKPYQKKERNPYKVDAYPLRIDVDFRKQKNSFILTYLVYGQVSPVMWVHILNQARQVQYTTRGKIAGVLYNIIRRTVHDIEDEVDHNTFLVQAKTAVIQYLKDERYGKGKESLPKEFAFIPRLFSNMTFALAILVFACQIEQYAQLIHLLQYYTFERGDPLTAAIEEKMLNEIKGVSHIHNKYYEDAFMNSPMILNDRVLDSYFELKKRDADRVEELIDPVEYILRLTNGKSNNIESQYYSEYATEHRFTLESYSAITDQAIKYAYVLAQHIDILKNPYLNIDSPKIPIVAPSSRQIVPVKEDEDEEEKGEYTETDQEDEVFPIDTPRVLESDYRRDDDDDSGSYYMGGQDEIGDRIELEMWGSEKSLEFGVDLEEHGLKPRLTIDDRDRFLPKELKAKAKARAIEAEKKWKMIKKRDKLKESDRIYDDTDVLIFKDEFKRARDALSDGSGDEVVYRPAQDEEIKFSRMELKELLEEVAHDAREAAIDEVIEEPKGQYKPLIEYPKPKKYRRAPAKAKAKGESKKAKSRPTTRAPSPEPIQEESIQEESMQEYSDHEQYYYQQYSDDDTEYYLDDFRDAVRKALAKEYVVDKIKKMVETELRENGEAFKVSNYLLKVYGFIEQDVSIYFKRIEENVYDPYYYVDTIGREEIGKAIKSHLPYKYSPPPAPVYANEYTIEESQKKKRLRKSDKDEEWNIDDYRDTIRDALAQEYVDGEIKELIYKRIRENGAAWDLEDDDFYHIHSLIAEKIGREAMWIYENVQGGVELSNDIVTEEIYKAVVGALRDIERKISDREGKGATLKLQRRLKSAWKRRREEKYRVKETNKMKHYKRLQRHAMMKSSSIINKVNEEEEDEEYYDQEMMTRRMAQKEAGKKKVAVAPVIAPKKKKEKGRVGGLGFEADDQEEEKIALPPMPEPEAEMANVEPLPPAIEYQEEVKRAVRRRAGDGEKHSGHFKYEGPAGLRSVQFMNPAYAWHFSADYWKELTSRGLGHLKANPSANTFKPLKSFIKSGIKTAWGIPSRKKISNEQYEIAADGLQTYNYAYELARAGLYYLAAAGMNPGRRQNYLVKHANEHGLEANYIESKIAPDSEDVPEYYPYLKNRRNTMYKRN